MTAWEQNNTAFVIKTNLALNIGFSFLNLAAISGRAVRGLRM
jgi:hypothetical protein